MGEKELKERLLKENDEFRKAFEEHQKYEKKLEEFRAKAFLTEKERLEEKEMKKKKLHLKDKMYRMMTEYKKSL